MTGSEETKWGYWCQCGYYGQYSKYHAMKNGITLCGVHPTPEGASGIIYCGCPTEQDKMCKTCTSIWNKRVFDNAKVAAIFNKITEILEDSEYKCGHVGAYLSIHSRLYDMENDHASFWWRSDIMFNVLDDRIVIEKHRYRKRGEWCRIADPRLFDWIKEHLQCLTS